MNRKLLGLVLALCMVIVMPVAAMAETYNVSSEAELKNAMSQLEKLKGDLTININEDIVVNGWTAYSVDGYNGAKNVTINGNGHTLSGLSEPLIKSTWAGEAVLKINKLTIADSHIVLDKEDAKGNVGVGAFVGYIDSTQKVVLSDCHVIGTTVEGGHWTGGLYGYAAGYSNQNDGPVFTEIEIVNCSVENCTITGKGSCGSIAGHATGSLWTNVAVKQSEFTNNVVKNTNGDKNKEGALIGTIGAAGDEYAGKEGGISLEKLTVTGNQPTNAFGRVGSDGELAGKDITSDIEDWTTADDKTNINIPKSEIKKPVVKEETVVIPSTSDLPKTGDSSSIALWLAALSMSVMAMVAVSRSRKLN